MTPRPRQRLYTSPASYLAFLNPRGGDDAVGELERAFGQLLNVPHVVAVPMARTGIYFALRALIAPGQKVILSPYTISEVVNMVVCAGGVPVFADIERGTCNINAAHVERLIDSDTGAVLATHFYGLACDIVRLSEMCRQRGVALIEDAAQALGSVVDGRFAGTFGDAGIFSFGLFKNVTSFFGGMVVTRRPEVAESIRREIAALPPQPVAALARRALTGLMMDSATHRAAFPITYAVVRALSLGRGDFIARGMAIDTNPVLRTRMPPQYLHRMRGMQARLAQRQLARVGPHARARMEAASAYHEGLKDIAELVLPPHRTDGSHTYSCYAVQADDRVGLVRHLLERRRDVAVSHHKNCADMACFAAYHRDCPDAARAARSVVYLPTYPSYGLTEVGKTIAAIRSFYRGD